MNKEDIERKKEFLEEIEENLAIKLADYYNYCIINGIDLMCDQNRMEQLFIAKTQTNWQDFSICRPITKASSCYKLLDICLNDMLWKELVKNNITGVNKK